MHKIKNNPTNKDDAVNKKYVDGKTKTISWADYQALSEEEKKNGTAYYVPDILVSDYTMPGIMFEGKQYILSQIDDSMVSNKKTWSSDKISKINVTDAKKIDSKPTYADGTITYIKDGTSYTTTNDKQWFYYLENGSLKQTIFIDGEELTIDGASVDFNEYIKKNTAINTEPTSSGAVSQFMVWEDSNGNNFGGMNFVTGDGIGRQFRMSDYEDHMTFIKSNGGTGVEERHKILDDRDIVSVLDDSCTNEQVASAKAIYDELKDIKAKKHEHSNKIQLDKISENDEGELMYNGRVVNSMYISEETNIYNNNSSPHVTLYFTILGNRMTIFLIQRASSDGMTISIKYPIPFKSLPTITRTYGNPYGNEKTTKNTLTEWAYDQNYGGNNQNELHFMIQGTI